MSSEESALFDKTARSEKKVEPVHDKELLLCSSYASFYRLRRGGKNFMLKTARDKDMWGEAVLKREYEIAAGCDHPHIVHVYSYDEGLDGLLMEYVEGRTLGEFMEENPSPATRKRVFSELLDAISYLHKRGVIHNDLKPGNILVSRSGDVVKVIDFGLSDDDAHYINKTPGCSPEYAAPELRERRVSSSRSDIYSLGLLLEKMFEGKYRGIVRKSTNFLPEKRYESVDALKRSWERRTGRRSEAGIVLGVAVLAAVTVGILFAYGSEKRVEEMSNRLDIKELEERDFADKKQELIESVENEVERQMGISMESLRKAPTNEFYLISYYDFIKGLEEYYFERDMVIDGVDCSGEISNLMQSAIQRYEKEAGKIPRKPDFEEWSKGMAKEEYDFYRGLLSEGKPWEPYREE